MGLPQEHCGVSFSGLQVWVISLSAASPQIQLLLKEEEEEEMKKERTGDEVRGKVVVMLVHVTDMLCG